MRGQARPELVRKMASAKFLEEALSTDVDESAVSAIVGSLETQLTTPSTLPHSALSNQNHLNGPDSTSASAPRTLKNNIILAHPSPSTSSSGSGSTVGAAALTGAPPPPNGLQIQQQTSSGGGISKLQAQLQLSSSSSFSTSSTPSSITSTVSNNNINAIVSASSILNSKPPSAPGSRIVATSSALSMLHQTLTASSTSNRINSSNNPYHYQSFNINSNHSHRGNNNSPNPTNRSDCSSNSSTSSSPIPGSNSNSRSGTLSFSTTFTTTTFVTSSRAALSYSSSASSTATTTTTSATATGLGGSTLLVGENQLGGISHANMPSTAAASNSPSPLLSNSQSGLNVNPGLLQAGGLPASGYLTSPSSVVTSSGILPNIIVPTKPSVVVQPTTATTSLANGTLPNAAATYLQFSSGSLANGSASPVASPHQQHQARVITQAPVVTTNPVSLQSSGGAQHLQHTHPTTHIVTSTNSSSNILNNNSGSISTLTNTNHSFAHSNNVNANAIPKQSPATLVTGVGVTGVGATTNSLSSQPLTAMTVNVNSGAASSSGNVGVSQSQTVVLTKPPQAGMTMTMAPTGNNSTTSACTPGGGQPQQPTIINASGGLQILNMNMNAVRAAAVNVGAVNVSAGNALAAGQAGQKTLAPRMIISPQVLAGARPGQPGVYEYQSEFSEFLMKNYKHSIRDSESEGLDDDYDGDQNQKSQCDNQNQSHDEKNNKEDDKDERAPLESFSSDPVSEPGPETNVSSPNEAQSETYRIVKCSPEMPDQGASCMQITSPMPEPTSPEKSPISIAADFDPDIVFLKSITTRSSENVQSQASESGEIFIANPNSGSDIANNNERLSSEPYAVANSSNIVNPSRRLSPTPPPYLSPQNPQQVTNLSFCSNQSDSPYSEPGNRLQSFDSDTAYRNTDIRYPMVQQEKEGTHGCQSAPLQSEQRQSILITRPSAIQTQSQAHSQCVAQSPVICYSQTQSSSVQLSQSHINHTNPPNHPHIRISPHQPHSNSVDNTQLQVCIPPILHQPNSSSQSPLRSPSYKGDGPSLISPEYKTPNQKCFTTDAQLHSQFLQYNQHHPITVQSQPSQSQTQSRYPVPPLHYSHPHPQAPQHPHPQAPLHPHPQAPQHPHPTQPPQQSVQVPQHPQSHTFPGHNESGQYGHRSQIQGQSCRMPQPHRNQLHSTHPPARANPMSAVTPRSEHPHLVSPQQQHSQSVAASCSYPSSIRSNFVPSGVSPSNPAATVRSQPLSNSYDPHNSYSHQHAHQLSPTRPTVLTQLPPSPTSYNPPTVAGTKWMSIAQSQSAPTSNPNSGVVQHAMHSPKEASPPRTGGSQQAGFGSHVRFFPPPQPYPPQSHQYPQSQPQQQSPTAGHRATFQYPNHYGQYGTASQSQSHSQRFIALPRPSPPGPGPNQHQYTHQHHSSNTGQSQSTNSTSQSIIRPGNQSGTNYAQQQYPNQYRGPQGPSQYYQNQPNSSGSGTSVSSSSSGPYPVVCRVSPIRYRYELGASGSGPGNYPLPTPVASFSGSSSSSVSSGSTGGTASSSSIMSHSYNSCALAGNRHGSMLLPTQERTVQSQRPRPGPYEADGYEYESYAGSSCQYDQAMRRMRTQITLQALPGLPPGAQGHHLLVKTENGQYQLLRVGMPAPAPTAASGTPVNPSTAATTTSMSIAPQLPASSLLSTQSSNHLNTSLATSISSFSSPLLSSAVTSSPLVTSTTSHSHLNAGSTVNNSAMTSFPTHTLNHHQQQQSVSTSASATVVVTAPGVLPSIITNANINMNNTPRPAVASSTTSNTSIPNPTLNASPLATTTTTTYRLQTVPSIPPTAASNASGVGMTASMSMQPQQAHPQVPQASAPSSAPTNANAATANSVSQMTAETAKMKCKNFLSFLLELSAKQNQQVARNVKALIQGLVDGKVNAEDFSDRLQKEVNSQPQPCLVGFLKKSLPHLRHSLATNELKIEGIKPPPLSSVVPAAPVTALIPQNQQVRPPPMPVPTTPVRIITPINSAPPAPVTISMSTTSNSAPIPRSTAAAVQQRFASPAKSTSTSSKSKASSASSSLSASPSILSTPTASKSSGPSTSKSSNKEKDKKAFASSGGDDDINDVAAMGGVNLAEESQRILGSTEFVGTQIRSCRDESFLHAIPLQSKIKAIAAKHGLEEPPPDVAAMISHATEERLKNLLEKLSVIAEHRLDVIKMDERYEVTQDVKGQLRFLEELDKLERKRHDEQEREMLIRAAKSRSKSEDPEQAKLKAKAKEMQRVAMEEMRQREANLTALQAIGPRKKPKLDIPSGSQSTTAQSPLGGIGASNSLNRPQMGLRPRLKRVNLRDLLFLMEQEKETMRSHFLYKHLLLK